MAKKKTISLRDKTPKEKEDFQLLNTFHKHIDNWYSYFADNNANFHADKEAAYNKDGLWTDKEIKQYDDEGRPRLTFNMLPKFITNVISMFDTRGADLEVRPKGTRDVPQQNIDLYTNILRNISFSSRNNIVYKTAMENAVAGGYGAFLVNVVKENPLSFLHTIRYKAINDPTTCGWDVKARDKDKLDGNVCFMGTEISKEEFKALYSNEQVPEIDPSNEANRFVNWVSDTGVVLMNMWIKEPIKVSMTQLSDGQEVKTEEVDDLLKINRQLIKAFPREKKLEIIKTEDMVDHKIMFYIFSRNKIYDRQEWLGRHLPLPFVPGIRRWVNKEEKTFSLIRWQKDAQRSYNYARNESLYRMLLQTYFKVMATPEMIGEHKKMWENPTQAKGVLLYHEGANGDRPSVFPQQPIGNDLQNEMNRSLHDLELISGRFDQNFGAQGNETSRVAIDGRREAGNNNVKEFFDNIEDTVGSGAIISMDLIPKVFDSERSVATTLPNGKQENKAVNLPNDPGSKLESLQFTVHVRVGPNIDLQQQHDAETMISITQSNPSLHAILDDLIFKDLNIQNSPQIVERIRRFQMPQIAKAEGSTDPIVNQQVQQQQQQQTQQQQQAQQMLELNVRKIIQKMQLDQQKGTDDTQKAQSDMMSGTANLMNAQTNRMEAGAKGVIEGQKIQAEENKANMTLLTEIVKLMDKANSAPANQNVGNINSIPMDALGPQGGIV